MRVTCQIIIDQYPCSLYFAKLWNALFIKRSITIVFQITYFIPLQSGFIKGDSTTYLLLHLYDSFCEAVDSGKEVRAIF